MLARVLGVVKIDDWSLIRRVSWATLHAIHSIFFCRRAQGTWVAKTQSSEISGKKPEKGDASFNVKKRSWGL